MSLDNHASKTMRLLFTCYPGYGHFHPIVPTALKLKERGHTVAFAVAQQFCPAIEKAGFEAFPAGRNGQDDPEFLELMGQLAQMPPGPESEMIVMRQVFYGLDPRRMVPDVVAIAQRWKPDLIIREAGEFGGGIAAEYLGLPQVTINPSVYLEGLKFFELELRASEGLDPIRQQWGLPSDPEGQSRHPYLLLNFSPPSFAIPDPKTVYPKTTQSFRPGFYDSSGDEILPDWVEQLPKQPTVYVTLGTEVNHMPGFYPHVLQTIIKGLQDEPINLIVTVGRDKNPADFEAQPANVHIERYIPHTLLLPHVDVMVMHGGSNSLLIAMDRGLAVVIIPLIADQFMNAQRCTELQLAPVVPLDELTPESIRLATREAFQNKLYCQNLQTLQAELHNLPDLDEAVNLVEKIAAKKVQHSKSI